MAWLHTYQGGIPARGRSPIPVLTGLNVEQLRTTNDATTALNRQIALDAGTAYRAAAYRTRLQRRRVHAAIWRTGQNQKTGQTNRQTCSLQILCAPPGDEVITSSCHFEQNDLEVTSTSSVISAKLVSPPPIMSAKQQDSNHTSDFPRPGAAPD